MDPRHLPVDSRLVGPCAYCGEEPGTSDHVPSKVLLDDPLPSDLPTVDACSTCNASFSLDEEHLACFLECALSGTTEPGALSRGKIGRTLARNPSLVELIQNSRRVGDANSMVWIPDDNRVRNVVVKLARGHAAFELSHPQYENPVSVWFRPLIQMSTSDRAAFEDMGTGGIRGWPEIGSRAFHRACGAHPYADQSGPWIVVQERRYRYAVDQGEGVCVRLVLSEYLACVVEWD